MITQFSSWKPKGLDKPKGIIVLTPPSQSDGTGEIRSIDWQEFATEYDLALVGCFFRDANPGGWIETYCNMKYGAGEALITYLKETFKTGDLPPIYMWGFSAGGQFNHEFVNAYPDLVAGFVVNKGGVYFTALSCDKARTVPGLYITGSLDAQWRIDMVKGIHGLNRVAGAKDWVYIEEEGFAHSVGMSRDYGMNFFKLIIDKNKE